MSGTDRRAFLKGAVLGGLGIGLGAGLGLPEPAAGEGTQAPTSSGRGAHPVPEPYAAPAGFAAPPIPLVRIGMVGVGLQGGSHVENFL